MIRISESLPLAKEKNNDVYIFCMRRCFAIFAHRRPAIVEGERKNMLADKGNIFLSDRRSVYEPC